MRRKTIYSFVASFAIFVFYAKAEASVPCIHCQKPAYHECNLARCACGFQDYFLHFECVSDWCEAQ